jgi:hypothetical protein
MTYICGEHDDYTPWSMNVWNAEPVGTVCVGNSIWHLQKCEDGNYVAIEEWEPNIRDWRVDFEDQLARDGQAANRIY